MKCQYHCTTPLCPFCLVAVREQTCADIDTPRRQAVNARDASAESPDAPVGVTSAHLNELRAAVRGLTAALEWVQMYEYSDGLLQARVAMAFKKHAAVIAAVREGVRR
jgi:hypothetical protein